MLLSPGNSPRHIASPSPSSQALTLTTPSSSSAAVSAGGSAGSGAGKRRRQSVLDEETYVASIEKIIERDFFPDLPRLRDRLDWLSAVKTGDPIVIRDAQLKILDRRSKKPQSTPVNSIRSAPLFSATPFGTDPDLTPSNPRNGDLQSDPNQEDEIPVDLSGSLDEFLSKYTSEDNDSFGEIIEKVNQRKREKYAHLLEGEKDEIKGLETDKRDRITDGFGTSGQPVSTLNSWKYKAQNVLMYHPAGEAPLTQEEKEERLKGLTKEINRSSTRFHAKNLNDNEVISERNLEILYSPIVGSTPAGAVPRDSDKGRKYDLDDLRKTPTNPNPNSNPNLYYAESDKKSGNGYNFVKTPSPAPGIEESPFMTWGEIEGTPLRLNFEEIGGPISENSPRFNIPLPPARDVTAHFLSRDAAKKIKERKGRLNPNPNPNPKPPLPYSPVRRSVSLSPAARKFVRSKIGKNGTSVDETLRASYRGSSPVGTGTNGTGTVRERSRFSRDSSREV